MNSLHPDKLYMILRESKRKNADYALIGAKFAEPRIYRWETADDEDIDACSLLAKWFSVPANRICPDGGPPTDRLDLYLHFAERLIQT